MKKAPRKDVNQLAKHLADRAIDSLNQAIDEKNITKAQPVTPPKKKTLPRK